MYRMKIVTTILSLVLLLVGTTLIGQNSHLGGDIHAVKSSATHNNHKGQKSNASVNTQAAIISEKPVYKPSPFVIAKRKKMASLHAIYGNFHNVDVLTENSRKEIFQASDSNVTTWKNILAKCNIHESDYQIVQQHLKTLESKLNN